MIQIYDLDLDTKGLQFARGLDDDGAVFAASSDATHGIWMTPEDLSDDW